MDKDSKILLMAVVIILVALVSFNLTDMTGKVSRNSASMLVSPSVVTFGKNDVAKTLSIELKLGKNVANKKMYLYAQGGKRFGTESILLCTSSQCESSDIKPIYYYQLNAGFEAGIYYFEVRDRRNNMIVESNKFRVIK